MNQVQKICCVNNAGLIIHFSIRWQDSYGNWNNTSWNSGNYLINQTRTSPDLMAIGVPVQAIAITPYVHAVFGKKKMGIPSVEYQPSRNTWINLWVLF
ncbi:hypothetical protein [Lyngbya sp. CCY1209]|jgi:hypothetical protein|uniref:hypothetical protein n=1 Tax=Lyngbya sp. CCY1209 TaxID=2886103 RepID=UPI002D2051F4|nr:hypothetical protein [Lyngbya sp. CCY1209]MEB3882373.1 hypothetical protein [Lyngbya sp. CCY1209]